MKKIIAFLAVVALTASLAIGLTTAYLTSTDEDVNVMTLGNVYIDQIEKERAEDGSIVDFKDNKPMLPAVYADDFDLDNPTKEITWDNGTTSKLWDDAQIKNVHDKFVFVTNTGKSPAYIRTWIAFEGASTNIHKNLNTTEWEWSDEIVNVEIGGKTYSVLVATYIGAADRHAGGILPAGETTAPSLLQVAMDKTTTNEQVNQYGETYEILVFSQAVQIEGFDNAKEALDAAFKPIAPENNPWNGTSGVAGSTGTLKNTLNAGGNIIIGADIDVTNAGETGKNVITADSNIDFADSTVTLNIPDATSETANWVGVNVNGGDVTFDATTGGVVTAANKELYAVVIRNGADLTINGGRYIGGTTAVSVTAGTLTINDGYFAAQTDNTNFVINCIDAAYRDGTAKVIIKGGQFLNWNPADNAAEGAGTNFLADGYKVVESTVEGGTLYTVVKA